MNLQRRFVQFVSLITIIIVSSHAISFAQSNWSDRRWLKVGDYQHFYEAWGWSYSWNGNFYEGMQWPALYQYSDNFINKRPYIGVRNWTDVDGNTWDTYVWGISLSQNPLIATPILLKETARFEKPTVFVNGVEINSPYSSTVDQINPYQVADRIVTTLVNTNLGITIKRRVLAFSQQNNDDYHILEYSFINTGNVDSDDSLELAGQDIEQFYFGETMHYATSREASYTPVGGQQRWGIGQWITFRGKTYPAYVNGSGTANPEDSLRAVMSWLGRHGNDGVFLEYDNIGAPDVLGDGRLVSPQFIGQVVLHVDTGPNNLEDDPAQPVIWGWNDNDLHPNVIGPPNEESIPNYNRGYAFLQGDMYNGDTTDMWEDNKESVVFPESIAGGGGAAGLLVFGPYNIPFGKSITIIRAEGASGLSREKCEEIGGLWLQARQNPYSTYDFPMPDGSVLNGSYNDGDIGENSADQFKDAWVMTGMDSVLKVFGRARQNYESGYHISQPPPPPSTFQVIIDSPYINLEWTDNPENDPTFSGYRLLRSQGRYDTTYQEIFQCGSGTTHPEIVHSFVDSDVVPGKEYYYYVVSVGSVNGHELYSSLYWTLTTEPARLVTTGTKYEPLITQFELYQNYPNPFNPTTTISYTIPRTSQVELNVYDLSGRLIKSLVNSEQNPGNYQVSIDGSQFPSGLYIYRLSYNNTIKTKRMILLK